MIVLVDYDNLPRRERDKGLVYLAQRTIEVVGAIQEPASPRVRMRLYGGWYGRGALTPRGQQLVAEKDASFPLVALLPGGRSVLVDLDLAHSLEVEPLRALWRTYRPREPVDDLICNHPHRAGCVNVTCPLIPMESFITIGTCSITGCGIRCEDLLFRSQQKLVDTMLTADFIHLASNDPRNLCLVSSDDDLWPAVRTAITLGRSVFHVHTRSGRATPPYYADGTAPRYHQMVF